MTTSSAEISKYFYISYFIIIILQIYNQLRQILYHKLSQILRTVPLNSWKQWFCYRWYTCTHQWVYRLIRAIGHIMTDFILMFVIQDVRAVCVRTCVCAYLAHMLGPSWGWVSVWVELQALVWLWGTATGRSSPTVHPHWGERSPLEWWPEHTQTHTHTHKTFTHRAQVCPAETCCWKSVAGCNGFKYIYEVRQEVCSEFYLEGN